MSEYDNLRVVKDAYQAHRNRNFVALRNCLAEDARWFAIGPPELIPTAGTRYGHDQIEQYLANLDDMEDIQSFEPVEFILEANKVVAIGELTRRVPSSGGLRSSPWVHVFTLRNGKIIDFRSFYDTAAAVTALEDVVRTRSSNLRLAGAPAPGVL